MDTPRHSALRRSSLRPFLAAPLVLAVLACGPSDDRPPPVRNRAELAALGYVDWYEAPDPRDRGVTVHREGSVPGSNLYTSSPRGRAQLIDMEGRRVRDWSHGDGVWGHVELSPEGHLFAMSDGQLIRLDADSKPVWARDLDAHHDLDFAADGSLFVLAHGRTEVEHRGRVLPLLVDRVLHLSPEGEVLRRIPLHPLFRRHLPEAWLDSIAEAIDAGEIPFRGVPEVDTPPDVYHSNSIQRIEWGSPPEPAVLVSIRQLDRIAIVALDPPRVLWEWGAGILDKQHHATLRPDGRILLFDNGVRERRSRILSVDPRNDEWEVRYEHPEFFTKTRGGVEELPGGNLLITESMKGRAFEVTPEGELVWEFWNPDVDERKEKVKRAAIYRVSRVPPGHPGTDPSPSRVE